MVCKDEEDGLEDILEFGFDIPLISIHQQTHRIKPIGHKQIPLSAHLPLGHPTIQMRPHIAK